MMRGIVLLSVCLHVISSSFHSTYEEQSTMDEAEDKLLKVTIPLKGPQLPLLGESLILPCVFEDNTVPDPEAPTSSPLSHRIKWSLISEGRTITIIVAMEGKTRVGEIFKNRVQLLGYPMTPTDGTIRISGLRSSDSGVFRCEVQQDIEDNHDIIHVEVQGIVLHYRAITGRYTLTYQQAEEACSKINAVVASPIQLEAAFTEGIDQCDAGWLSDYSVRYPINYAREQCDGDKVNRTGIKSYGKRNLSETYDVYCFAERMNGTVFHVNSPEKFNYSEAALACTRRNAQMATTGQLYLAWRVGMDICNAGWLADRSVRYPINVKRPQCGGGFLGVRTVYLYSNQTGYPLPESLYDVFCYNENMGIDDEDFIVQQTTVAPQTRTPTYAMMPPTGIVFHYRRNSSRYSLNFDEAKEACRSIGAIMATPHQLQEAYEAGFQKCEAGWLMDQSVRYPIIIPRPPCAGNLGNVSGVRSYGIRPVDEPHDVYCYVNELNGKLFHVRTKEGFTYNEAASYCLQQNATLATTANIYAAWKMGYDKCRTGWLLDRCVRYSINKPREACGRGKAGVHTVYTDDFQQIFPTPDSKFDAYCFRAGEESGFALSGDGSGIDVVFIGSDDVLAGEDSDSEGPQESEGSTEVLVFPLIDPDMSDSDPGGDPGSGTVMEGDLCQPNPCSNGATCMENGGYFQCLCLPSYGGGLCEIDDNLCMDGWSKFQGNCYLHISDKETWLEAEYQCRALGSHLVSIITPEEQNFVNAHTEDHQWIGLTDKIVENDYSWTDGTPLQYENWMEDQPDNFLIYGEDCVVMMSNEGGQWKDVLCDHRLPFTCKRGSVSCSSPPEVENAYFFGIMKDSYPINTIIRYQCYSGFIQRHLPVIHCKADGTWEEPQVECIEVKRSQS